MNLDIDGLRSRLGQWESHEQSKHLARSLAVEMASVHLRTGHDVVVPQLVARIAFIEVLERAAADVPAVFDEIVLRCPPEDAVARFYARRAALAASGARHPEREVVPDAATMGAIAAELEQVTAARPRTRVLDTTAGDVAGAYQALRTALQC